MKQQLHTTIRQMASHPKTKHVLQSIKPEKSIWGFMGIVFFFILPEVIAFVWGADITAYAKASHLTAVSFLEQRYDDMLVMMFEDGGSWINLGIGFGMLGWIFY